MGISLPGLALANQLYIAVMVSESIHDFTCVSDTSLAFFVMRISLLYAIRSCEPLLCQCRRKAMVGWGRIACTWPLQSSTALKSRQRPRSNCTNSSITVT